VKFCDITYDIMCLTIFSNHKICVVYVVIHLIYIYIYIYINTRNVKKKHINLHILL